MSELTWKILISADGTEGMHYSPDLHRSVPGHRCSEMCERDLDGVPMRLIAQYRWSDNEFETGQLYYDIMGHGTYRPMPQAPPADPDWHVRRYRLLNRLMRELEHNRDEEYLENVMDAMASVWGEMTEEERTRARKEG